MNTTHMDPWQSVDPTAFLLDEEEAEEQDQHDRNHHDHRDHDGNSAEDPADTQTLLDRVDTVRALLSECNLPRIAALVESGHALLGFVLRDADLLVEWLEECGAADASVRQALAAAYCVAIALGADDEAERVQLAVQADRRARGAAIEVAEQARIRVEAGHRLST